MKNNLINHLTETSIVIASTALSTVAFTRGDTFFGVIPGIYAVIFGVTSIKKGYDEAEKYQKRFNSAIDKRNELKKYKQIVKGLDHTVEEVEFRINADREAEMQVVS